MKTKRIKIIPMLAAVVIGLSACSIFSSKDEAKEVFSEEKAGEVALAYLNEKYDDEFVITKSRGRKNSIAWGTKWYCADVIRKSNEGKENLRKYEVSVSWDTSYTILGDTVMFEYYQDLFTDYAAPIIEDKLDDIPFRMFVFGMGYNSVNKVDYGFLPDAKIPESIFDENNMFLTDEISFAVYIPDKLVDNKTIGKLGEKIKAALNEESYGYGYIYSTDDEHFNEMCLFNNKELNMMYLEHYHYIKNYRI